ncbi:2096_t:CDS:1, partial [Cetraspora pellucida]
FWFQKIQYEENIPDNIQIEDCNILFDNNNNSIQVEDNKDDKNNEFNENSI